MAPPPIAPEFEILVVEDNPGDRDLIFEYLEDAGLSYRADWVGTLREAVGALGDEPGHTIVLLDLGLPDGSGIDSVEAVIEAAPSTPIVVLTGRDDDEVARAAIRAGAQDYLIKGSFTPEVLARVLRYSTERKAHLQKIGHLNRVLSAVRAVNQLIARERAPEKILDQTCRILVESRGYQAAWACRLGSDGEPTFWARAPEDGAEGQFPDLSGRGCPECVDGMREERSRVLETESCRDCGSCVILGRAGQRCSAVCRLEFGGELRGFLGVSLSDHDHLGTEEEGLLREVAEDVSFALSRVELERRSAESERRYQALYNSMVQGVVYQDRDGVTIAANPAAERIFGMSADDLVGRDSLDRRWRTITEGGIPLPGEEHPAMVALRTGRTQRGLLGVFNTTEGDYRWVKVSSVPEFRDGERSPFRVFSTFEDVTGQKEAEENLRVAGQRLNIAVQAGDVGLWDWNLDTGEVFFSAEWKAQLGYEDHEIEASYDLWKSRLHPDDVPGVMAELEASTQAPWPTFRAEFRLRHRDGSYRWILSKGAVQASGAGSPARMVGSHVDITDQKQAEVEARRSLMSLQLAETIARLGYFERNWRTGEGFWSDGFCRLLGFPKGTVLSHDGLMAMVSDDDRERVERHLLDSLERGSDLEIQFRVIRADGQPIQIQAIGRNAYGEDGRPHLTRGTFRDITREHEAREALQESERQLRTLMDNLPGMAYRRPNRLNWPMAMVSRGCTHLLGLGPEEFTSGRVSYREVIHPDDREAAWEEVQGAVNKGEPFHLEYRVVLPSGEERWVSERGVAVGEDHDGTKILEGLVTDIDDRVQAEAARRGMLEKYRLMADHTADAIWQMTPNAVFTYINPAVQSLLGFTPEEVIGTSLRDYCDEENFQLMEGVIQDTLESLPEIQQAHFEATLLGRDGTPIEVEITGKVLVDQEGRPKLLQGITRDITMRKMAERTLRESERNLNMAQRVANIGSWSWHVPSNTLTWSDQMFRIFGVSREEFSGDLQEVVRERIHPEDIPAVEASNASVMEKGEPVPVEYRVIRPDGSERTVYAEAGEFESDENGVPVRLSGIVMDITEQRIAQEERERLQSQLNQAQKMESVGRLAGGVAHDFNNMLQTIIGNAEFAGLRSDLDSETRELLSEIHQAADRSADLTRQLLAFARQQTIDPVVLDVNDTIQSMLRMLQRLIGEEIQLVWRPQTDVWPLKVDPTQIDQILANLAVNARDAIGGVGAIEVETRNVHFEDEQETLRRKIPEGDYVALSVRDDGQGMDRETLDRIFEPFFTTKGQGEGTGLGLATVYGIVKQNDGFIDVKSEVGEGTVFTIYLPRHAGSTEAKEEEDREVIPDGSGTILIVEDEVLILRLTQRVLEQKGYVVLVADKPGEAIRLAEKPTSEIELLITDVVMPEMNGRDLGRRIAELQPNLRTLFMSGYTADVIASRGVLDEGVHFIQKPFSARELLLKVQSVMEMV